jgi:hypothetical protein
MSAPIYPHDPQAELPYRWDWTKWLAKNDNDTIVEHTIFPPTGITLDSHDHTDTTVTAWLSGGVAGRSYTVTCEILTAGGKRDQRSIRLDVENR